MNYFLILIYWKSSPVLALSSFGNGFVTRIVGSDGFSANIN